jgi:arylsulfatase A-like enzyme
VWDKTVLSDMAHVVDMYATLLKLGGGKDQGDKKIDGLDLWPMLTEKQAGPRKEVLINVEDLRGAIRVGEWKLVVHAAMPSRIELFQLSNDPEEAENRVERESERLKEMMGKLNEYAYDMAPAKYLEELGKPHSAEIPTYWGHNPARK